MERSRETGSLHRLGEMLPRWLSQVPLYRRTGHGLDRPSVLFEGFRRLPLISKADIRRGFPKNFLPDGVDLETLLGLDLVELEHTSGTSEPRIPLLLARGWWAEQEERALRLNSFVARVLDEFPEARRVTIVSPVCSGDICYKGVPSQAERVVGQALYVNLSRHPFLWSEADLARMAEETLAWQPQFLDVDPVYGMLFARYCERRGLHLPSLQFILCSYEYPSVAHRRVLQRVFGVPVFDLYGSTETGHLLMETVEGRMAPSHETAYLEVIQPDAGGVGELIVTTLTNDYMPLIRYRIGDLVEPVKTTAGTDYRVHGRSDEAFVRPDGARVTTLRVDDCFEGLAGIAHYQLSRRSGEEWLLRFVPEATPPHRAELAELQRRLQRTLAAKNLALQETDSLLAEASGKFRLVYPNPRGD